MTPPYLVVGHHDAPPLFTHAMADMTSKVYVGPLEIPALGMEPCDSVTSVIESWLANPITSGITLTKVPALVHADRPLEIELAAVGVGEGTGAAESVASWISAHARLAISIELPGQLIEEVSLPVSARQCCSGWIARVLIHPATWSDAVSVSVVSLSLAGQPLSCHCLPATLRVGYNHAPAPAGAVYDAAQDGDVPALQAALDAGGSTEEADEVRDDERPGGAP